jgi:hypothetical protein
MDSINQSGSSAPVATRVGVSKERIEATNLIREIAAVTRRAELPGLDAEGVQIMVSVIAPKKLLAWYTKMKPTLVTRAVAVRNGSTAAPIDMSFKMYRRPDVVAHKAACIFANSEQEAHKLPAMKLSEYRERMGYTELLNIGDDCNMQRHKRDPDDRPKYLRHDSIDILDMSWPQQRSFRHNDPEGYARWVADLKEEMGPWFQEDLVLPEFRHGVKKPRPEVHKEDLDDCYILAEAEMASE